MFVLFRCWYKLVTFPRVFFSAVLIIKRLKKKFRKKVELFSFELFAFRFTFLGGSMIGNLRELEGTGGNWRELEGTGWNKPRKRIVR